MSQRRKLILAVLLVFTVALAALSVYITTRQQAPDDSSAASTRWSGDECRNAECTATKGKSEYIEIHRCYDNLADPTLNTCVVSDPQVIVPGENGVPDSVTISAFNEAGAVCGRVQVDVFTGPVSTGNMPKAYAIANPPSSCLPASCPANLESLTPVIRVTLKTATGTSERVLYYRGNELGTEIPINEVDKTRNLQMFVCDDCDESELTGPFSALTAEDFYKGRFRVRVIDQNGVFTHDQIYENRSSQVGLTWDSAALKNLKAGSIVRVQVLKNNNNDNCKGTNIKLVDRVSQVSCGGDCFRSDPNVAKGNCATGYTCSNSGSNSGKCILDACAADPLQCQDDVTQCSVDEEEPEPLVCGDACSTGDDCGTGHSCNAGKCELNTCISNPAACQPNKCEVLPTNLSCGSSCTTSAQCGDDHSCNAGKCELDICVTNPTMCETNKCNLKTNLSCGSSCINDGTTNQCGTGHVCDAELGETGSCKLISCAANPAACSDAAGCNLVPLPSCGDATCNANELCERTTTNGTTYRQCLDEDTGSAPSGELVASCTFTGANACQQLPPEEEEPPSCGETCGTNGLCPNNHTCNGSNVCVLNTCLTPGACSDNTCTPVTTTTPICGGACANNTQCPTNHTCTNGKCVLNGCTAATCTNGCTVIPATGILDDARFLLVGMALVTLGYLTYKYRIGRSLSLGLIDSEALFVEKLEKSVEKKMRRRNK